LAILYQLYLITQSHSLWIKMIVVYRTKGPEK